MMKKKIHIIDLAENEREKGEENMLEEIVKESFPTVSSKWGLVE